MDEAAPKRSTLRQDAVNLPNLLTLARIAMIPLVLWLIAEGTPRSNFWASMVYAATAITDLLDGWLARKMGLTSLLGKFLDPLADKLLVMATLVFMAYLGRLPMLGVIAVILMLARELSITALRTIAMGEGVVIASNSSGKDKTALQMVGILLMIVHDRYVLNFGFTSQEMSFNTIGLMLFYISLILAFISGGEYIKLFVDAVEAKDAQITRQQAR